MTHDDRDKQMAELARRHLVKGDPTGWFEELYRAADGDAARVPWADLAPHPALADFLARHGVSGRRALVIGCGLGDDAEALSAAGADVTAFDISATCIAWCRRRFPDTRVHYEALDLILAADSWPEGFATVVEIYTVQSLPLALRETAFEAVAALVAPGGRLLVACRGRDDDPPTSGDDPTFRLPGPPWAVSHDELGGLERHGLTEMRFADYEDDAGVRRFVAEYARP
ncbi:MAG: class I SAM-dependent methyltransferase [Polyangiaceae bacterium]|nr:class I SAM-dependent methyltransferase [Polyangiaceae bacterium]